MSGMYSTIALAASESGSQYEQQAVAAAQAAGSLRVTSYVKQTNVDNSKSVVTNSVIDMTQTESTTVINSGKSYGSLLVVPNLAYTKGTATYLEDIVGLPTAAASKPGATRWSGENGFGSSVVTGVWAKSPHRH